MNDPLLSLIWEGPQTEIHSLAKVNRNICSILGERGQLDLHIGSFVAGRSPGSMHADVAVCHQWPPSWTLPKSRYWVLMQPWEFGALPKEWYAPMKYWLDQVWVYSRYNKECYVRSGIDEDKIKVVPLGVDETVYHPGVQPLPLEDGSSFRFLFVGGTIWRKGTDILLQAYREEFTADEDVCLVIKDFGTNSFYKGSTSNARIAAEAAQPGHPRILYLDTEYSEQELAQLYKACDCLVHPYRGEGFGLPIIEAMACGTPAIVPDKGPSRDFADDDSAFFVPCAESSSLQTHIGSIPIVSHPWWLETDPAELRIAMRRAYENRSAVREKGRNASEKILTGFTWKHTADAVHNAILELAGRL